MLSSGQLACGPGGRQLWWRHLSDWLCRLPVQQLAAKAWKPGPVAQSNQSPALPVPLSAPVTLLVRCWDWLNLEVLIAGCGGYWLQNDVGR